MTRFVTNAVIAFMFGGVTAQAMASNDNATDLATMLESMPEIYGNIQFVDTTTNPKTGTTVHEFEDNGSTIGFKHSHAVSEGIEGFIKAEFEFSADNRSESSGLNKVDEAYIGIRGDFGSIQVGTDDTVYEWIDMIDTSEYIGLDGGELASTQFNVSGGSISNEGDNFQYISPEIMDGLVVGVTVPFDSDTTFGGALAAKLSMDGVKLGFAYAMGRLEGLSEVGDSIGFSAAFSLDDLTLITQFETRKEGRSGSQDGRDFWGIEGVYVMGANTFSIAYGETSYDPTAFEDTTRFYVQALHNMSDNVYVYLEFSEFTDIDGTVNNDSQVLAVGAAYLF